MELLSKAVRAVGHSLDSLGQKLQVNPYVDKRNQFICFIWYGLII